ncbi:MAG: CRISPR-associated helicase Cas3' [Candidatus Bathyarchaeia archaeon]
MSAKYVKCTIWNSKNLKYSHEGKKLSEHIEEVKDLLKKFLDFYGGFNELHYKIADYLAEYHDYGKLCNRWSLDEGERPPPHSPWSVQWLMDNRKLLGESDESKKLTYILWYFILKHHSKLTGAIPIDAYNPLASIVRKLVSDTNFINFKGKIDLVDVFGFFKIADVLSASGEKYTQSSPMIDEERIKKIIGDKIDEERWLQQLELKKIGDLGLLRAYTGWGKTTASLLFFINKHVRKAFYLLPTITAINKFYEKVSQSFPNEVGKYFYLYDAELTEKDEEIDRLNEMFFAEYFLSPITITTIDQFLLAFLQYSRYHTKRGMFRKAGIILDEVHLLNPLMLILTTYFIRRYLPFYQMRILLMSATMPEALSKYFKINLEIPDGSFLDYSEEYSKRRRVMLEYIPKTIEREIDEIVKRADKPDKKTLIILNTVDKAVELARILKEKMPSKKIILLHSRFMYRDRRSKEDEIEKEKGSSHILISTQISEVSLDISYYLLFTEISPLASMIQRFGRVNRYGRKTDSVNAYLYEPTIDDEFYYPYSPGEIETARKVIRELEGEALSDERQLLAVFDLEYTYEDLMEEVRKAEGQVNLRAFEDVLDFFFSLDIGEDKLLRILNYRSSFSSLIVPDPKCVEDKVLNSYLEHLLSMDLKVGEFGERRAKIAKIKDVSVPVPLWWIRKDEIVRDSPYPVLRFKDKIYNRYFGLIKRER